MNTLRRLSAMKPVLNRLLPPFSEGLRAKPRDMLYLAADRPPWPIALGVGLQHAMVALMLLIYCVIAGSGNRSGGQDAGGFYGP